MITMVVSGLLLIVLVAAVVGIFDAMRASSWREVAAERRLRWEARRARAAAAPGRFRRRRAGTAQMPPAVAPAVAPAPPVVPDATQPGSAA